MKYIKFSAAGSLVVSLILLTVSHVKDSISKSQEISQNSTYQNNFHQNGTFSNQAFDE